MAKPARVIGAYALVEEWDGAWGDEILLMLVSRPCQRVHASHDQNAQHKLDRHLGFATVIVFAVVLD